MNDQPASPPATPPSTPRKRGRPPGSKKINPANTGQIACKNLPLETADKFRKIGKALGSQNEGLILAIDLLYNSRQFRELQVARLQINRVRPT